MPRILHLDLTHGITSGSFLGALVDLGVAPSPLLHAVGAVPVELALRFESGSGGVHATVEADEGSLAPADRRISDVQALIDRAEGPPRARELARATYRTLSRARVGDGVPLHAGPDDSLLHVLAATQALCELKPDRVTTTRVDLGSGDPDDAVVELLGDHVEALTFDEPTEHATTPLGAALLTAILGASDLGLEEPPWHAHPLVGRGLRENGRPLVARLGMASPGKPTD